MVRRFAHVLATTLMVAMAFTGITTTTARAAGIHAKRIARGLNQPVAFTFAPDGRILYVEKASGEVRLLDPGTGSDRRFFRVRHVVGDTERGMLGIALDPDWPATPYAYVYATRMVAGHLRNQILRIRQGGGAKVIFSSPASANPYHNGGRILFGPDHKLYAMVGEGHDSSNAQDRTNNDRGKILRMTASGGVPRSNPFHSRIWSYGNRNSFGFDFDPETGRLWETENGPSCNDELNLIRKGANDGWGPNETCSGSGPRNTNNSGPTPRELPKYWYANTIGITGMAFCEACNLNGASEGTFFFGDVKNGRLYRATLDANRNDVRGDPKVILTNGGGILSLETSPDGSIYFSDFGAIYELVFN